MPSPTTSLNPSCSKIRGHTTVPPPKGVKGPPPPHLPALLKNKMIKIGKAREKSNCKGIKVNPPPPPPAPMKVQTLQR